MNKNKYSIILLFLLLPLFLFGQIKIHKHITQEDGLVNRQVTSMIQDSKGYIWFATYDGVSKWDGNNFENIQTHSGMLSPIVLDIKEGADGKIYIGCYQGGILVYDNGVLDTINEKNGLISNDILSIGKLRNGDLLFAGSGNKITKLKNGSLSDWGKEVNYPNEVKYTIRDFYEAIDGTLYIATQQGLLIYKNNSFKILTTKDGLNNNLLISVKGNGKGTIYTCSYKGINKIENGKITKLTDKPGFSDAFCFDLIIGNNGKMYAATINGVIVDDNGIIKTLTEKNGLSFNYCMSVFQDNNGMIYFGTSGKGVSIYNPKESIVNYNKSTGLPNENIWSILKAKDQTLYFGSEKGLIVKKENETKILNSKTGLVDDFVRVVKEGKDGKILVGTDNGFSILDNKNIKNYNLNSELAISKVYSIEETDSGKIYLGTQTGVIILKDEKIKKVKSEKISAKIEKELGGKTIFSVSKTKAGAIVFGTLYGLVIYDKNEFTFFTTKNGLVDNIVNATHVRADGSILVGTYKGLNIIRNGIVVDTIDVNDGLSHNSVADIEEDKKGRIFVATTGVNILTNIDDSLSIKHIYKSDGLVDNDFTLESTFLDEEENLWLGTLYGVTKYNPNLDVPITTPPNLYLTGLQLFNEDYSLSKFLDEPVFNYDQNYLKFIFTGINLSAPEKIKYMYRLSNVDKNWVESTMYEAPYTNLDDGKYTFEVKAGNEWGYWSKPSLTSFTISPAWWETWWFRLAIVSFIGGLLWLAFQYRLNYLLKVERLRTKIASDLHDEVGSLLTQISLNVDLLSYTKEESKRIEKSNIIRRKSKEVISMMSDVIWSIDSRNDNMESLIYRIQSFAESFVEQKNIKLKFINQITDMKKPLNIDFRQNIMMITKEVINNAVKYSDCSTIEILLKYKNNIFELIISDNGKGFELENIKRGNGLKNIKMRAKLIDAKVEFINEGGCKIHLTKTKL
ncbi:MAG: two-component regulator propeller domain-containing protein [Melioribacteraceae bacterium]